jgi:hypothetical protein
MLPRPTALRLYTRARVRPPAPPFGLSAWSPDAIAVAVFLDGGGIDLGDPAQIASQLPRADDLAELAPEATLFVLGSAARGGGMLRWFGVRTIRVGRTARCTALVAKGYVGVGAGVDDVSGADLAWGLTAPC